MKRILFALILFLMFAFPANVKADIAPPEQPPGSNPAPDSESTQVRMQAETVKLKILDTPSDLEGGRATVTASFNMKNLGSQDETMMVRFPVGASDGWGNVNEISNFQAKVNGKTVGTHKTTGEDPNFVNGDQVPWTEFQVTFAAGKEVDIEVSYQQKATEFTPFVWFTYIFSTGAGWKDSIGSIDLSVEFPYAVNDQNLLFDDSVPSGFSQANSKISGNTISWHFDNLEPGTENNFRIEMVSPGYWQNVLKQQSSVTAHPKDGEAWGMLAKSYKALCFSPKGRAFRSYNFDAGAQELCQLSREAYDKAVTLKPKDPLWHAGYADLLGFYAYFAAYYGYDTRADAQQAMHEIQQALKLAPDDPKVQEIAAELSSFFPDGMVQNGGSENYDYPWLTASPLAPTATIDILTPPPTETKEIGSLPADTPTPVVENTAPSAPSAPTATNGSPKLQLPFCGSLLLIPFGVLLLLKKHLLN